jgi:ketosteroid isomerase-like protein
VSREHVEAFRRGAAALEDNDMSAIAEFVHPDLVFEPQRAATEGAYTGLEGIRRFAADTHETFGVFKPQLSDVRDLGDDVLAIGTITVRGSGSGLETEIPAAIVATYRDGLLWRYKDYGEAEAALRAAGLEG